MMNQDTFVDTIRLYNKTYLQALRIIGVLMNRCKKNNVKLEKSFLDDIDEYTKTCRELQAKLGELTSL